MIDLIFIAVTLGFFILSERSTPDIANPSNTKHPMETILMSIIAILLIGYLTVAMLYPEKF